MPLPNYAGRNHYDFNFLHDAACYAVLLMSRKKHKTCSKVTRKGSTKIQKGNIIQNI